MNRIVNLGVILLVLSGLAWGRLLAGAPAAPDIAANKIRLLSEALHARDTGDMAKARGNLEELLALSPNDETVRRLLASLERVAQKKVSIAGGTLASDEAEQLARAEEQRMARLLEAAGAAVKEARELARQNQYAEALDVIDRARATLPENSLMQDAVAELDIAKAEITAAREKHHIPPPTPGPRRCWKSSTRSCCRA